MKIHDIDQRSEEWDSLRLGIPTASEFHSIVTPKKGELSKSADRYMHRLLAEWYFGGPLEDPQSQFQSQWMERGQALEHQAVSAYEFETGLTTERVGFVMSDSGLVGCSPDRFVGDDGGLEIKCPSPVIHMGHLVRRAVAEDHYPQVQGCMLLCERKWWDVVSYCPPFPAVIIRVPRDEEYIGKLSDALVAFTRTMMQARVLLEKTYGPRLQVEAEAGPADDFNGMGVSQDDIVEAK